MKLMIKSIIASALCMVAASVQAQDRLKVDENFFGDIQARQIGPATMSGRISALDAVDRNPADPPATTWIPLNLATLPHWMFVTPRSNVPAVLNMKLLLLNILVPRLEEMNLYGARLLYANVLLGITLVKYTLFVESVFKFP